MSCFSLPQVMRSLGIPTTPSDKSRAGRVCARVSVSAKVLTLVEDGRLAWINQFPDTDETLQAMRNLLCREFFN